ncbi:hypothetical protein GHT06_015230 [Daphnia sinensis]|uniref:RNA-directed DNA polymerase n=1 Tax=Daphnia sinensis TaxID=1820382 RepID=A0AAD5KS45_9CRUS|nr:hypothetical protein GHT06_015230 [Daphnia sinensis]
MMEMQRFWDSGFGEQSGLQVATEGESQAGSEVEQEEVVERRELDSSLAWDHGDGIRRVELQQEAGFRLRSWSDSNIFGLTEVFESFDPETSSEGEEEESEDDSEEEMAVSRLLKIKAPPVFSGKQGEDAADWLDRYESVGDYNRWNNEDKRSNFGMYLEGPARQWFQCITVPNSWEDMAAGAGPQGVPARVGLKSVFLNEFVQEGYARYRETKLCSRKQGIDEPPQEYFYEIMNLCRQVDPAMAEATKLDYLFRGHKPTLLEKIWILKPKTCNEFLSAVKLHSESAELANKRAWAVAMMAVKSTKKGVSWADQMEEEDEETTREPSFGERYGGTVGSNKTIANGDGGVEDEIGNGESDAADFSKPQGEKNPRSPDGRPMCHLCGVVGHIRRFCPKKKQKEEGVTGKAIGMLREGAGDTAGSEGIPLLLIDLGQLVTKEGRPKLWLGELPVGLLGEEEHGAQDGASEKIIIREGRNLPPRSLVAVEIEPLSLVLACSVLIEPSTSLGKAKGISTGRILIKRDEGVALADPKEEEEEGGEIESRINKNLTPAEIEGFRSVLNDFKDCFARSEEESGRCTTAEHIIPTKKGVMPIYQNPRASAYKEREIVQEKVQMLVKKGVAEPATGPWASPVVLVRKKNGEWRVCVDYRYLNAVTIKDVYPLPRIEDSLARLDVAKIFSIMDLESGYWQVPLSKEDKTSKCKFGETELVALGHLVGASAIRPDPENIRAVQDFPKPAEGASKAEKVRFVRSFVGLCSYYRRCISGFAQIAKPLTDLTREKSVFQWGPVTILAYPNYRLPFEIHPDACGYGVGAVLLQRPEGAERPLAYASRLMTAAERDYLITEKECLALDRDGSSCLMLANIEKRVSGEVSSVGSIFIGIRNRDCTQEWQATCRCGCIFTISRGEWDRRIRNKIGPGKQLENYTVKDGVLFRVVINPIDGGSGVRLCVPKPFRKSILLACHDDMMAGDLGEARTWERVKQRYYWIGLYNDVLRYVKSCMACQARKKGAYRRVPGFLEISQVERPFDRVGMDILGPFPRTTFGNRYIVVAVDYVTKWAFFVSEIVFRHGDPRNLTTDQRMCFMAEMMKRVTDALETNHRPTTAYHPKPMVSGDHSDWDVSLEYVRFACNTSRHKTTGRTPFFLMHGREAVMPIDVTLGALPNEEEEGGEDDSYEIRMQRWLKKAFAAVEGHTQRAQERYKAYYDRGYSKRNRRPPQRLIVVTTFAANESILTPRMAIAAEVKWCVLQGGI